MKQKKKVTKKKRFMINKVVYNKLIEAAKQGKPVYYGELASSVKLNIGDPDDRIKLFNLLEKISVHEHNEGRPLLSVIVINREAKMPGYGFFKLARRLGLQQTDNTSFFYAEVKKVFDYWRSTDA